jgi:hypothetical protein
VNDYYSNPPSPNQPQPPYPYSNPPSASPYPQSPPIGVPQPPRSQPFPSPSFPSYYTSNQPVVPPQPPKSKAKIILIVAAVVMFAVGGVFGGLYVATESDHDKANSVLEDKKNELAGVKQNIASTAEDKSNAQQAATDLQTQNDALQPCVDATQKFIYDVPSTASDAEKNAAVQAMRDACK